LLALLTDGDLMANTPVDFLVEDSDIDLDLLYVGQGIPALEQLPEHDVMFVAIGEADAKHTLLLDLQEIVSQWPRPVINRRNASPIWDVTARICNCNRRVALKCRCRAGSAVRCWSNSGAVNCYQRFIARR
jgi:hypothetical protein